MKAKIILPIFFLMVLSLSIFVSAECIDSDNGQNKYLKGTTLILDSAGNVLTQQNDYCEFSAAVKEFYCDSETGEIDSVTYACGTANEVAGCVDGACQYAKKECFDSDKSDDSDFINGYCESKGVKLQDICEGDNLKEASCIDWDSNYEGEWCAYWSGKTCELGCNNGACIKGERKCEDSDGGENYYEKGEVHLYGDFIYGLKGTKQIDTCILNNEPITSCSGTNCYLKENFCDKYQRSNPDSSLLIASREYICPFGCEGGACIGKISIVEPIREKPKEIPQESTTEKIDYFCSGCELEEKCYPFGFRKSGNFCSDVDNQFVEQKKSEVSCDNNFECSSNLCIDSQCISSGFWQKIMNWFKNLFG